MNFGDVNSIPDAFGLMRWFLTHVSLFNIPALNWLVGIALLTWSGSLMRGLWRLFKAGRLGLDPGGFSDEPLLGSDEGDDE